MHKRGLVATALVVALVAAACSSGDDGEVTTADTTGPSTTVADLELGPGDVVVGRALYKENARGQIQGDLEGITKLVVDANTRKLLGCHVIGERASELVHIGLAVMHLGGTVDVFIDMVFNFPTLSESFKYAAYDVLGALAARKQDG